MTFSVTEVGTSTLTRSTVAPTSTAGSSPRAPEQWLVGPHSRPQVDLVASQRSGLGERCRPATYRRSARRKYGCFSVERRGISSDQARDEHAPGHTVDREVMKDQEQPSGFGPVAVRADGIQPDCADHLRVRDRGGRMRPASRFPQRRRILRRWWTRWRFGAGCRGR